LCPAVLFAAALLLALASTGCASSSSRAPLREANPSAETTASTFVTAMLDSEPAALTTSAPSPSGPTTTFAIIGDYGIGEDAESTVASLVASWHPTYILTTGDDYYSPAGGSGTGRYDNSTGAFYGPWIKDFTTSGMHYPVGTALVNGFFPTLGNHDYSDTGSPAPRDYLAYFALPGSGFTNSSGNERYYDFVQGPIHFFALNSNAEEPDGTSATSKQAHWLQRQLAASTSTWNVVYDHHPPYSSDNRHGSSDYMRWPFAKWGADAVLSGHAHTYERVMHDGIPYLINGLGGASRYDFGSPADGSASRYHSDWGAQKVTVTEGLLTFEFYDVHGRLIDRYHLHAE
jgi:tartrate-resistant acid phosphatase type 5